MTSPYFRARRAPFLIPARVLVAIVGLIAISAAVLHLVDEVQRTESAGIFLLALIGLGTIWLVSLGIAWRGSRIALFIAGLLAFAEFGLQASNHFITGGSQDISTLSLHRGLAVGITLLALGPACLLTSIAAIEAVSNPRGRSVSRLGMAQLATSVPGVIFVLLHTADDLGRGGFGSLSPEDGSFLAMVIATVWALGALWTASHHRRGSVLTVVATSFVLVPFYTLHLAGGVSLATIAQKSGPVWAVIAGAMAGCAALAFALAAGSLVTSIATQRRRARRGAQPAFKKA
jgi:hypothetical protein